MTNRLVPLMNMKRAEAIVRALSMVSENIIITDHAAERMEERGFDATDLSRVLASGSIFQAPTLTEHGDWKCKVVKRLRGSRDAGVVTVIARGETLVIITMEWEDVR